MGGTIAIWYDSVSAESGEAGATPQPRPRLEIHFNLWRDLPHDLNVLDIGMLLTTTEDLRRFYMYVPAQVDASQVHDLSQVLKDPDALNAVFNAVVTIDSETDRSFETSTDRGPHLTIHRVDIGHDLILEPQAGAAPPGGTRLVFTEALSRRLRRTPATAGERPHYLRFRIRFPAGVKEIFSETIAASESFLSPSIDLLELTEFRLNEKRSYPPSIAGLAAGKDFNLRAVHYFLIRDVKNQLVAQHSPNHRIRRLEEKIWANYLAGAISLPGAQRTYRTERMLIYHWRDKAKETVNTPLAVSDAPETSVEGQGLSVTSEPPSLEDFSAFASFRRPSPNLPFYAIGAILLGAVGSATATVVAAMVIGALGVVPSERPVFVTFISNLVAAALIFAAVLMLLLWVSRRRQGSARD